MTRFKNSNRNTGDWNTGNCNTGDWNTGNRNTGDWNTGNCNTGDWNTGNRNTGDWNTGDWNTGDWNSCNGSNGFFCTQDGKILIFDKPTNLTLSEFWGSKYYSALRSSLFLLTEWIEYSIEEKENDKAKELIGGYLKKYGYKDACAKWWGQMADKNKEIIMDIPNFDKKVFFEITGIEV